MPSTFRSCMLIAAILSSAHESAAQPATVRGTIADGASGKPLVGAFVAAINSGRGRERSDAEGQYVLDRIPAGSIDLEFHCPSATLLGWPIEARKITLRAGQDTVVDVRVALGVCGEPPYSERRGTFRGTFSLGFEESRFVPCPDSLLGLPLPRPKAMWLGGTIWVEFDSASSGSSAAAWPNVIPDVTGSTTYFVMWHGVLKGPGTYGHMGVSDYQLEVDTVYSVLPRKSGAC